MHDLGGMDGFVLPERDQGFALHAPWERELWGLVFALRGVPGTNGGRAAIERMPPILYLSYPYYGKWLYARERAIIESGIVTAEELANRSGPLNAYEPPPAFRPASPVQTVEALARDASELIDAMSHRGWRAATA